MQPPSLTKFGFRIRTRVGLVVENLLIHGRDENDAQRKLRQMYRDCEVIECVPHCAAPRAPVSISFEEVAGLISR